MKSNDGQNKASMKFTVWAVIFALVCLFAVSAASFFVFFSMGYIALSWHGWIALIAGAIGSVVLGGGLMALSFYSARSGYDEEAHYDPDDDSDGGPFSR